MVLINLICRLFVIMSKASPSSEFGGTDQGTQLFLPKSCEIPLCNRGSHGYAGTMRHDQNILLRLAESRQRRLGDDGRPVFGITLAEAEGSARSAMRLAQASKSQVESRSVRCTVAA